MIKVLTVVFLFLSFSVYSQHLILDGEISGYFYNPNNGLISKSGNVSLEGSLAGVKIEVIKNGKTIKNIISSKNGDFHFKLPFGEVYQIKYSKIDYETVKFDLDLTNIKDVNSLVFKNLELILNKYIQYKDNTELGLAFRMFYDDKAANFGIEEKGFKIGGALSKKMDYVPLVSLVKGSIKKNEPYLFSDTKKVKTGSTEPVEEIKSIDSSQIDSIADISKVQNNLISNKTILSHFGKNMSINGKESLIEELKNQLEKDKLLASTPEEFALIEEREALIVALSSELELSKEVIAYKEEQLVTKNKQIWMLVMVFVLLVGAGVYVYFSLKKKEQLNLKIISQGNRIGSSINYAQKIQTALLPTIESVQKSVPNSFVLYKPKDVVSGDFYWVKEIEDKIVIAAIDCTGHGVPGAFMSMIGITLFNQIILIEKNLNPESILKELHKSIVSALNQDQQDPFASQDGMDVSIAVFDKNKSELTYAGAMNSLYMVSEGVLKELEVDKHSIGGFSFQKGGHDYANNVVKINPNESIYLMSDGLMDQFGGVDKETYNLNRLENLLLSLEKKPIQTRKSEIEKVLKEWQGDLPQTDDILLMGLVLKG
jgi:serine phosphatase RsbU (regulator of sigma subunit)